MRESNLPSRRIFNQGLQLHRKKENKSKSATKGNCMNAKNNNRSGNDKRNLMKAKEKKKF